MKKLPAKQGRRGSKSGLNKETSEAVNSELNAAQDRISELEGLLAEKHALLTTLEAEP